MQNISKKIFLNALVCPRLGWLMRSGKIHKTLTTGKIFRMEQEMEVKRRARDLYPSGILVEDNDMVSASKKTKSMMNDPNISIIFEGAFLTGGFEAKADILIRKKRWLAYD